MNKVPLIKRRSDDRRGTRKRRAWVDRREGERRGPLLVRQIGQRAGGERRGLDWRRGRERRDDNERRMLASARRLWRQGAKAQGWLFLPELLLSTRR